MFKFFDSKANSIRNKYIDYWGLFRFSLPVGSFATNFKFLLILVSIFLSNYLKNIFKKKLKVCIGYMKVAKVAKQPSNGGKAKNVAKALAERNFRIHS